MGVTDTIISGNLMRPPEKNKNTFFSRLKTKMKYGLTLNSMRLLLMKTGIDISPYYFFREGSELKGIPEIKGNPDDFKVEFPLPSDMEKIEKLDMGWSRSRERISSLTDGSEKCICLKHNNEIAAFMWINFKEFRYKSTVMKLKDNEAYLTDMFTVQSYRGLNLAPYLRYRSYELLRDLGKNMLYSISICFNSPAIRFKEKLEAKKMRLVFLIRFFKKYQISFNLRSYKY